MASLSYNEIRARLALFAEKWNDAKDEDADAKSFWDELFLCYGTNRRQVAKFEVPVNKLDGNKGFIDVLWKGKLIVEHKSRGKDLKAAKVQAEDYMERLKPAERPRFLVTSDFQRFQVFDLHNGHEDHFTLDELPAKAETMGFLGGYEPKRPSHEAPVNIEAVERLGKLYDAMKDGGYPDHDLQAFLVRVLFCMFAEDTAIFEPESFTDIILNRTAEDGSDLGIRLAQVFETLDAEKGKRQRALDESIAGLPYVNGRLFSGRLTLAATDSKMRKALLACCEEFDWSAISPAIFGSLFQGVMEPAERRAAGAHYTGEDNILKVIKPLFLDALRAEFAAIKTGPQRGREQKLEAFHAKLAKLKFFDPACGCGNFLIITYRELRRLEIELLKELHPSGQGVLDVALLSKLDVDQFYGIEIDEFPSQIARVALWLMDHVMNVELGYAFGQAITRLPLTKSANIVHGNALQVDWKTVIHPEECSYILGNPPFVGYSFQSAEQKEDIEALNEKPEGYGVLDFVSYWFIKASIYIRGTNINCAFVATNSICQGEQAGILWGYLFARGIKIHFAHRTFAWESEARGKAHVHCIIAGFGCDSAAQPIIFEYETLKADPVPVPAKSINQYLVDAPSVILAKQTKPLFGQPIMIRGSGPVDGGHLLLDNDDKKSLLTLEPQAEKWIRPFLMGDEFINNVQRWCLWLKDCPPDELRKMPLVTSRVQKVREMRLASKKKATQQIAAYPSVFGEIREPKSSHYLAVPAVSSERRKYIPIGYLGKETVCGNKIYFIDNASLYEFGVLSSSMHMAWTRTVCGRLKSDYNYSNTIVYNNLAWPASSENQKASVEKAAQAVLDVRAKFPSSSLADLYDPNSMPPELAKSHSTLDSAVDKCYRAKPFQSDRERVEFLFCLYENITVPLANAAKPKRDRKRGAQSC